MKRILSKIFLVGAAAAAIAVPATAASASTGAAFAVQSNNGVLITTQHVFVGEVLSLHGHAERVIYVYPTANNFIFRVAPALPDPNTALPFAVVG